MGCDIHIITEVRKDGAWKYVPEIPKALDNRNYSTFAVLAGVRDDFNLTVFEPRGVPADISAKKFRFESYKSRYEEIYKKDSTTCFINDVTEEIAECYSDNYPKADEITATEFDRIDGLLKSNDDESKHRYSGLYWAETGNIRKYFVIDAYSNGGHFEMIPYARIYKTLKDYIDAKYADEYDEDADDYGYWKVNFECEDMHSASWLSLKDLLEADYSSYTANKSRISRCLYEALKDAGAVLPDGFSVEDSNPSDFRSIAREVFEPTVTIVWQPKEIDKSEFPLFVGIDELSDIAKKYDAEPDDIRIVFCFDN